VYLNTIIYLYIYIYIYKSVASPPGDQTYTSPLRVSARDPRLRSGRELHSIKQSPFQPLHNIHKGDRISQEQVWALNYLSKVINVQKRATKHDSEPKSWFEGRPGCDLLRNLPLPTTSNPSTTPTEVLGCLRNMFELLTIPRKWFTSRNVREITILS